MKINSAVVTLMTSSVLCLNSWATPLANVNDIAIDSKDVQAEYSQLNEVQKGKVNKDPVTRREIVESAINTELVLQAAKRAGLEQDDDYKKALERFKRQYLTTRFVQKSIESRVNGAALKDYYEKNKTNYDSAQIHALHILVASESDAASVLTQAKATKSDKEFSALAKKYSVDPTAQDNGGDLGYFTRDRMLPEFAAAAFSMRKGEIKGPVRSFYGYHIIKVVDMKSGRLPGFEEVEQRVKEDLKANLAKDLIVQLRSKASVKFNEEAVNTFKL